MKKRNDHCSGYFIMDLVRLLLILIVVITIPALRICAQEQLDTTMNRIFNMSLEELMNTKVTIATRSNQSVSESPAIVSVITAQDIKNLGAREFEEILQYVPGFEVTRGYAGYYNIGVRGVKDSRTTSKLLMMIDGMPFNQVFFGDQLQWGHDINLDEIERIEIIRGPGSAMYGRNAFSCVINIITKNAKTSDQLLIKGILGTFNTRSLSGYYGFKKDKFNASLAVRRVFTDVTDEKFDDGFGNNKTLNLYRDNICVHTNIGLGKFTLTGMYLNLKGGAALSDTKISNKIYNYSLSYHNMISPNFSISAKIYGHNSFYMEDIEQIPSGLNYPLPASFGGDGKMTYADIWPLGVYYKPQSWEYIYGAEAEFNLKFTEQNSLLVGFQADKHGVTDVIIPSNFNFATGGPIPGISRDNMINYEPGWFVNNGHSYQNFAVLLQDIWYPFGNLGITIGARYDIDSEIGGVFNPRTGIVWTPYKSLNIKLLYGKAYRAPAPSEQFCTLGYAIGNKDLKPEIINTYEIAISHRLGNSINSLSFFRNNLNDMIYAAKIIYVDPNNKYYNIGKNTSTGVEFENKLYLGNGFSSFLNYAFTKSENTDSQEGKDTTFNHPDIAPHRLNLGMNYTFLKYYTFNFNMFYRSKMDKLRITGTNLEVQDKIGNYAILNSSIRVDGLIKGICLGLHVYNLLDKKYYSQDNQHQHQAPQPGRQFIVSLSYSIK